MARQIWKLLQFQKPDVGISRFPCATAFSLHMPAMFHTNQFLSKDLYSILGVTPQANPEEIKSAYYKLSQVYHPDKHAGDKAATEKFVEIKEAHEILSDPSGRERYDSENLPKFTADSSYKKKEFKFHHFKPERTVHSDWEYVKTYSASKISSLKQQIRRSSYKAEQKRIARHLAQKVSYHKQAGAKTHAKFMSNQQYK